MGKTSVHVKQILRGTQSALPTEKEVKWFKGSGVRKALACSLILRENHQATALGNMLGGYGARC